MSMRLVYATYPSLTLAEAAARRIVEAGLAACGNILPSMVSIYRWEGQLERAEEVVLLLKTTKERAAEVVEAVRADHPYEVPAVFVLPVEDGSTAFLGWIASETF
ncbi:CutA protein [Azorhizobium caulinodans ORS 571]|uniref:CutA protein n=1 Tax=Azorhizobium caulinodans (strain ATCC 43989 / DSM 5975 / JCM 20966 / LMG 6465 / NBRC 14845 / NCIMB 13405 / ORS 571) TaxID=438753 RepID=A8HUJ6_AZOC5|nr:divalent-cation tolerance protein CutA [Azorhizobium caulinodans]BAF86952.1 CutA protein [Azorhizobium caulinodans ORS 571]